MVFIIFSKSNATFCRELSFLTMVFRRRAGAPFQDTLFMTIKKLFDMDVDLMLREDHYVTHNPLYVRVLAPFEIKR